MMKIEKMQELIDRRDELVARLESLENVRESGSDSRGHVVQLVGVEIPDAVAAADGVGDMLKTMSSK